MRSQRIIRMTEIALMSAVLCIVSPFAIPVPMSPVPLSLATFGIYVTAMLLGAKRGAVCVLVYLLLGMAGLPVFSGFSGGPGVLFGPTGGYLIGYVPCVVVTGWMPERIPNGKSGIGCVVSMCLGTAICYLCGTAWFLVVMIEGYTVAQALLVCVVPYLLFDIIKILVAAGVSSLIKRNLRWQE